MTCKLNTTKNKDYKNELAKSMQYGAYKTYDLLKGAVFHYMYISFCCS